MPPPQIPLPRFVIIGAQKSVTRWLRHNLGEHPQIFTALKEPAYFDNEWRYENRGLKWYRKRFDGWDGEEIVGEATPGYMIWRHDTEAVAGRIKETLPDVRLIAILRNPIDRAASALVHHRRRERVPPDAGLLEIVRANPPATHRIGLIAGGWYGLSLEPYVRIFGKQLRIFLHDEIKANSKKVYRQSLRHIGKDVDRTFLPAELTEVRYTNQAATSSRVKLTQEERLELYEYFREDLAKLETLIDRDLSSWDPANSPVLPPTDQPGPSPAAG